MSPDDSELSALIKRKAPRYAAPEALRERIRQTIAAGEPPRPARFRVRLPLFFSGLAASAALAAALTLVVVLPRAGDPLLDEVVASHVRSLQVDHLTDVVSSDQHTVKPWFNGKLDFSPPVQDFADHGYSLVGGRVDYLGSSTVAALVYRHGPHPVNVFVWPQSGGEVDAHEREERGYNVMSWRHAGMAFWVVSDLNAGELREFAQLLRKASS
jgi:anti-sigma factor RsiW